jgi:hypothetical protein
MMTGLLIAAAVASGTPQIADNPAVQRRIEQAPSSVRNLIVRRAGCNYFASEEPYDEERARDLEKKARSLGCAHLARDERVLRQRYAKRRDVLTLLAETQDVIY